MSVERELPGVRIVNFLPDELSATVGPIVDANLDLLPNWIVELNILWDDEGGVAKMRPHIDYRRAKMTIGPQWIDASAPFRRRTIMHEFMHCQLGPLHILATRLVEMAGKDNVALTEELHEQLRIALEQTTVDVTALVERLVDHIDRQSPVATTSASLESERSRVGPTISHRSNGAAP